MTPSWYLVALAAVLGAGFGWTLCGLFAGLTASGCRRGTVDFTAAAARGELDLDWGDPRQPEVGGRS